MKTTRRRGERREERGEGRSCIRQSTINNRQSTIPRFPSLSSLLSPLSPHRGFTLIELLVTITIIGILAAMVLGALQKTRQSAREYATKATIAKLNAIIMERYESYMYRRMPINTSGLAPNIAAQQRLLAIRELMRMEMPDCLADITPPITPSDPALYKLYNANQFASTTFESAKCLYMVVSMGSPEAMEQFSQNEIGNIDGNPVFIDGWGNPICWLRWAPGFSSWQGVTTTAPVADSDIQSGNPSTDPDPFDPRRIDTNAFHLIPLICSAGPDEIFGLRGLAPTRVAPLAPADIFQPPFRVGAPDGNGNDHDNITNHHIEMR